MNEPPQAREAVFAALRRRRSVRSFAPRPVPSEVLWQLIEAAGWAPSSSNSQPWKFLLVEHAPLIADLAQGVESAASRWLAHLTPEARAAGADYARHFTVFRSAPVLVVPLYRPTRAWTAYLEAGATDWQTRLEERARADALISVSLAVANLLLAAHALDLGACVMTGPLLAEAEIRARLAVPPLWQVHSVIPVGYPEALPPPPPRRPPRSIAQFVSVETSEAPP